MAESASLSELVLRWQELREQGRPVSAEELCAGCPELLDALRKRLQALQSMEHFLGAAPDGLSSSMGAADQSAATLIEEGLTGKGFGT